MPVSAAGAGEARRFAITARIEHFSPAKAGTRVIRQGNGIPRSRVMASAEWTLRREPAGVCAD